MHTKLMLHAGATTVTGTELKDIPTPQPTDTWHPIPHHLLLGHVREALTSRDIGIISEEHGLQSSGHNYFGVLTVGRQSELGDFNYVVGLRNSHAKRFPAGLVVGLHVTVCDNLSFSGEIRVDRKHTAHIERDLEGLVLKSVGQLSDRWSDQEERVESYRNTKVSNIRAHDILIRGLDGRIITAAQLPQILGCWRKPQHEEFEPRTAWSLFNCFTEVLKNTSLFLLAPRTQALHGLLDQFCGVHGLFQGEAQQTEGPTHVVVPEKP
jgi:hypothetical protein